jgi:serine kinase of HPr protein (carbohydrate metabolism regulator)
MMDGGARLVADDQVETQALGGRLRAVAPETLDGLMEVRGVGVVSVPTIASVEVSLVIELMPSEDVPRMPEPSHTEIEGVRLPLFPIAPFEPSAAAKLRLAVRAARHEIVLNE